MNLRNRKNSNRINQLRSMRFFLITASLIIFATSCEDTKVNELEAKVNKLEVLNLKLKDSIDKMKYEKLMSLVLVGIPKNEELIPGKPNEYNFIFHSIHDLPPFRVYSTNDKKEKRIIYEDYERSRFTYSLTPENEEDKSFKMGAFFFIDSVIVEIPALIGNTELNKQIERMDSIK